MTDTQALIERLEALSRESTPHFDLTRGVLSYHRSWPRDPSPCDLVPLWAGEFRDFNDWVNFATKRLSGAAGDSHGEMKSVCIDALGRRCTIGAHFMRARDEDAFPVRYFWECVPRQDTLRNALPEIIAALREREGEAKLREWRANDPDAQPDGTAESLATCATMLETYGPDCFPANEHGQVHFARCMMDSVAAEIRAFLANTIPPTGSAAAHAEVR